MSASLIAPFPHVLVKVLGEGDNITRITLHPTGEGFCASISGLSPAATQKLEQWLVAYAHRQPTPFPLPLDLSHFTEFSKKVYIFLTTLPFGSTLSYGELAEKIGKKGAARAVGQALHHNPFPLILPCHRIFQKNGKMGGFAFGLPLKEKLLRFELSQS